MRMLRVRISSLHVFSANASVPDGYAQGTHQYAKQVLNGTFQISYVRSVHAPVHDSYCMLSITHQFLTRMLSACKVPYTSAEGMQYEYLNNGKTDVHAEHVHKEPMRMVRVRISS
jgi:hypothetical protein